MQNFINIVLSSDDIQPVLTNLFLTYRYLSEQVNYLFKLKLLDAKKKLNEKNS